MEKDSDYNTNTLSLFDMNWYCKLVFGICLVMERIQGRERYFLKK